ncbi:transporter [Cellulophaga baltica]|uniref:transporter n=1 Tax=Cellulophaga TaxID=104264 RepID=UPI001C065223|nr:MULTISPECIES: transporter [Cellulophaga]MBU2996134.1 transporter [Cellulophaga baltica]MDO6767529.1 transporter [Cellulophaga sp. 1_MG-2023]
MKNLIYISFLLCSIIASAQYTDVINSNRPGESVSAYAVGKNVIQAEFGIGYEQQEHSLLLSDSNILSTDIALRYGLLFESLEIYYEGTFQKEELSYDNTIYNNSITDFSRNRIGLKYLVYDPYKNPERNKPNLISWRANHKFQWRNLIPAVSIYAGATFVIGDNPYYPDAGIVAPRVMIATQSKISPRVVFISNIAYDRIGTEDPELSYIVSLTHAFRNPKWSVFIENQGIKGDRYADILYRTGIAHLFKKNLQADVTFGGSFKDTPTRIFGKLGVSYRLDMHKDKLVPIDEQKAGENGQIGRKDMKKKTKKEKKKDGGAEDVDLGPSKKQLKKLKKAEKKKQKESGTIDF